MEKAEEVEEEVLDSCSDEVARCHGVVGCKGAKPRFQGGFFFFFLFFLGDHLSQGHHRLSHSAFC